ncbi:substrate-binding domain-containing protein [Streptomyces sp. NPDC050256]|uniref:substrate-binding domain-containing protein n=1 Tax=Streptomyces sp. NPDC050256 TaxID=3365607 RepID=UPI00379BF3E4
MTYILRQDAILRAARRGGAVRVAELAAELGVSQMTIRRDINQLADQGELARVHGGATLPRKQATRDRPGRHPAEELSVGLVVPQASLYYRQVIEGAQRAATALGVRLTLGVSCYDLVEDQVQAEHLLDGRLDGLLLAPSAPLGEAGPAAGWIAQLPVPAVIVERRRDLRAGLAGLDNLDHVATDHELGAVLAARHLASTGHRRIALLSSDTPTAGWIVRGLDAACSVLDLDASAPRILDLIAGDTARIDTVLDELVASGTRAVLAHPDEQASLLLQRGRDRGMVVPRDLAVVSYDDDLASLAHIPLTAVAPPRHAVGRTALSLLVRRLREGHAHVPQQTLLTPRLHVRASTEAQPGGRP